MTGIPIQRYDLFVQASRLIQRYRQLTPEVRPVGIEVALAIQFHRAQDHPKTEQQLPWVGSSHGMPADRVAQDICDPFYTKSHPHLPTLPSGLGGIPGEPLVWPLFNQGDNGLIQPMAPSRLGGNLTERRWLKGCNSQEGIGCHALASHLWQDEKFLAEDRDLCPFRLYDGRYPLTVDQGRQTCGFDDHPCGWQVGLPKMLQVVGRGKQAEVLQAEWTEAMWSMLIPSHRPLPVYPLIVVLYFGHATLPRGRQQITPEDLRADLDMPIRQFRSLFEQNPDSPLNRQLLNWAEQPPMDWENPPKGWQMPPLLHHPAGGRVVIDPDERPQFRGSGLPAGASPDPLMAERRRRRQLKRTEQHREILHQFRRWFRLAGLEVREDQYYFDFLAVADHSVILAEVKLLYQQDLAESIQEVVGQLLFYERFGIYPWVEQGYHVYKCVVFDRPLPGEYIDFLFDLGIYSYWLTEGHMIDGPESSLRILRQMEVQICTDLELDDVS